MDTAVVYGPKKSNAGGTWLKKQNTAVEKDCGTAAVCCLVGDCSVILMMCCPLSTEFIYRDPTTNELINEKGHILPEATNVVAVSPQELEELQAKHAPGTVTKMTRK